MFSILGEWSGKVRSTPTPNDCLRTVNVSRTPEPCRLITTPSNTCTRWRLPSITLKWTRTVSPALKTGTSRNCACSMLSMMVLMGKGAAVPRRRSVAEEARTTGWTPCGRRRLMQRDAVRRPVGGEDLADQVLARHGAPHPRVARGVPVVPHHEVVAGRHLGRAVALDGS